MALGLAANPAGNPALGPTPDTSSAPDTSAPQGGQPPVHTQPAPTTNVAPGADLGTIATGSALQPTHNQTLERQNTQETSPREAQPQTAAGRALDQELKTRRAATTDEYVAVSKAEEGRREEVMGKWFNWGKKWAGRGGVLGAAWLGANLLMGKSPADAWSIFSKGGMKDAVVGENIGAAKAAFFDQGGSFQKGITWVLGKFGIENSPIPNELRSRVGKFAVNIFGKVPLGIRLATTGIKVSNPGAWLPYVAAPLAIWGGKKLYKAANSIYTDIKSSFFAKDRLAEAERNILQEGYDQTPFQDRQTRQEYRRGIADTYRAPEEATNAINMERRYARLQEALV